MSEDLFDKWTMQWEKALKDGVFKDASPSPVANSESDDELTYWAEICRLTGNPINEIARSFKDVADAEYTSVKPTEQDGKSTADITDDLGKLPNPAQYPTRGKDTGPKVTPNWAGGKDLEKLQQMKMDLEQMGAKLAAADGMGDSKKAKGIMDKLESLKKEIDDLSDSIAPEFRSEYLS